MWTSGIGNSLMMRHTLACRNGSSLVISLILLVLMTLLILGFFVTVQLDRQSASTYADGAAADRYAKMGVDVVAARILTGTSPTNAWISGPGRIVTSPYAAAQTIELFSGSAASVDTDISVALNVPLLMQTKGVIANDSSQTLPQKWIYLRKDGTQEVAASVPTYDSANPIIGRYAFWADDLSARINWNTATGRTGNTNNSTHPSQVDLTAFSAITPEDAQLIEQFRKTNGFFNTRDEIRMVNLQHLEDVAANRYFALTHLNHSPILNPFGDSRMALTTQTNRLDAGYTNFFDVLKTANNDPGKYTNLSSAKVNALFGKIYGYLNRNDWPVLPGRSFVQKYGAECAAQIALNLIEYVRSAESTNAAVEPIRGTFNSATGAFTMSTGGMDLLGNSKRIMITEMGVEVPTTSASGAYQCKLLVEVYLPPGPSASVDLTEYLLGHNNLKTIGGLASDRTITAAEVLGSATLNPGEYRVISRIVPVTGSTPPPTLYLRTFVSSSSYVAGGFLRMDVAPLQVGAGNLVIYSTQPGVAANSIESVAVDDPFSNRNEQDWERGPNTFGDRPSTPISTIGQAPAVTEPTQDTDSEGKVTDAGPRFQTIDSPAVIGRVHSGIRGNLPGVPWRTIRLQPAKNGGSDLPDWAMLDLFTVPLGNLTAMERSVLLPSTDTRAGLININNDVQPFEGNTAVERPEPLTAALVNPAGGSVELSRAELLAENILRRSPAAEGYFYGSTNFYVSAGEAAEVMGVADTGELSEAVIREIVGLLTVQGNVFAVYSVGQSVRHAPSGKILVEGERRTLTLLERRDGGIKTVFQQKLQ